VGIQLAVAIVCCLALTVEPAFESTGDVWLEVAATSTRAEVLKGSGGVRRAVLSMDRERLEKLLNTALPEGVAKVEQQPVIGLPLPDGSTGRFAVEACPVMAPGLAIRFPEILTFRGTGIDDPGAVAWFSLTLKGFHGMILSDGQAVFINPVANPVENRYEVFERSEAARLSDPQPTCTSDFAAAGNRRSAAPPKTSGSVLRTYRTAIAATGEYTQYHGGTKADALSAIAVVMHRINGVFRRELAVEFELVADNDTVIYTDPGTDPYTHNDNAVLVYENQATLDSVIGSVNYDHGHLFNTHNGGRAGDFGTVCRTGWKGQGVSGLRVPAGEVFMIDLGAHELGHQFGAAHTYNSLERTCSIARNEWAAYEPGSGSTIMSYAGVCGDEDITAHSEDYFHGISLDEIGANLAWAGGSCGLATATGNEPPVVDAGPGYTIPAGTPFTLAGTGSDASPLTFTWEQFDLGPPSPPMSDDGLRPLFRSHSPIEDSRRVLPPMDDVLNGRSSIGETLPTTTRILTFRLTARDGLGGVGDDTTVLQVDGTTGPFEVTAPVVGDRWAGGETETVVWNVAGTDSGAVTCDAVDILFSTNNGVTFDEVLVEATPNDGSEEIVVPPAESDGARIMITCSDNIFFAVSPRVPVILLQTRQPSGRVGP